MSRKKLTLLIVFLATLVLSIGGAVHAAEYVPPEPPKSIYPEDSADAYWEPHYGDLNHPSQNPMFSYGNRMTYSRGTSKGFSGCRGMTWVLHKQRGTTAHVGYDAKTNPYRGDTRCAEELPILCIRPDGSRPPFSEASWKWVKGSIALTKPVAGTKLTSLQAANNVCVRDRGYGWRMAEFHDGGLAWEYWGAGPVASHTRFWVHINDQLANPWDHKDGSSAPFPAPVRNAPVINSPEENPAYVPGKRIEQKAGLAAGRRGCQGMTWTVLHQANNLTHVGADGFTNAYVGDTTCNVALPVLCLRVAGYPTPSHHKFNPSYNWSGSEARLTRHIPGNQLTSPNRASSICQSSFGTGWRMATFHDGNLTYGSGGWEFWAYGGLKTNIRFWVAIGNQNANPWSPWGGGSYYFSN